MRSVLAFIFLLCIWTKLLGQGYRTAVDTLTYSYRIGGALDSIDLLSGFNTVTYPGAGWNTRNNVPEPARFIHSPGRQLFWNNSPFKNYIHTGLPHLGVGYMFGSNAQQYVKAEFQQVFHSNVMLNIRYIKKSSNGILRNSAYNDEDVQLALKKTGKIYSFDLRSSYESSKVEQSGGITNDTLPDYYSLQFIPVNRSTSELRTKRSRVMFDQFVDLLKDSTKAGGLCFSSALKIKNFKLEESDTLYGIYPLINYDSLVTYDQHQWSSITGGAGLFWSKGSGSIKIVPNITYWNFQNLGRFRDTVELTLKSHVYYSGKRLGCEGNVSYNLQGAQNEWGEEFSLRYSLSGILLKLNSVVYAKLPDYYQRYALGNNTLPIDQTWTKQVGSHHTLQAQKEWRNLSLEANVSQTLLRKNYWFIDSIWRNDTLTKLDFIQFGTSLGYHFKSVYTQLNYRFTKVSGMEAIIPTHQLYGRIYLKGGIFKARKMISYTGVEIGYLSAFQSLGYLPQVGALSVVPSGKTASQQVVLHYYGGFQIDEFKFFFRLENIHSFWSSRSIQQLNGYPVSPFQIKLGVTWDFFD